MESKTFDYQHYRRADGDGPLLVSLQEIVIRCHDCRTHSSPSWTMMREKQGDKCYYVCSVCKQMLDPVSDSE